jgi:hypothetical protein
VLHRRSLDLGSVDYRPTSDEVTFHLILERGGAEGDWLLVLLGTPEATHAGLESHAEGAIMSAGPPDPSPAKIRLRQPLKTVHAVLSGAAVA